MRPRWTIALALAAAGCGIPADPDVPDLSDGSMRLVGVLIADSTVQTVLVGQTDGLPLEGVEGTLTELSPAGEALSFARGSIGRSSEASWAPPQVSIGLALQFPLTVVPGRRYQVRVTAPGRPSVTATTTVPGDFDIETVAATGDPPGTGRLGVRWTASEGGFRYVVHVRAAPDCITEAPSCQTIGTPWAEMTAATAIDTVVPATALPADGTRAIEVAVLAFNRELYQYFTTGAGGPFTVQPKQNVAGGYGVLGAWVRRARVVPR